MRLGLFSRGAFEPLLYDVIGTIALLGRKWDRLTEIRK